MPRSNAVGIATIAALLLTACGGGGSKETAAPTLEVTSCSGQVDAATCALPGTLVGESATGTLTLRNTGPGGPLVISNVGTGLSLAAPLSIGADGCTGHSLVMGQTCTIEIVFAPSASGAASGQFTFATNVSGEATVTVSVSARAQDADAVYGTVTLPAGAVGKCVSVVLDDDNDPSNGGAMNGIAPMAYWVRATSTAEPFEITGVPAGSYYLFTFVDMDESDSDPSTCVSTGAPTSGDLFGYDGDAPLPPLPTAPTVTVLATTATSFNLTPRVMRDSVSGTVTLPSNAIGKCVSVVLDDDNDPSNGGAMNGIAPMAYWVRATSTAEPFEITGVPAGSYYLFTFVDMDESDSDPSTCVSTGAPTSGDLFGYDGDAPLPPLPTAPTVTVLATTATSFNLTPRVMRDSVSGTVTLPVDAIGKCVIVALDDDADPSNGVAMVAGSPLARFAHATLTSHAFAFTGLPQGRYYLFAVVDMDGSNTDPTSCVSTGAPNAGDLFGYYGGAPLTIPAAPTVDILRTLDASFDFGLTAIP